MWLTEKASYLYDATLALLYPQQCGVCGCAVEARANGSACDSCWDKTALFSSEGRVCWRCGDPMDGKPIGGDPRAARCGRCDEMQFDLARSCGPYELALRSSVIALKSVPNVPRRIALMMDRTARMEPLDRASLIVPVPLHPERLHERGFNQAELLARRLSVASRVRLETRAVVRTRHANRHRAGMDARARRESVESAFKVIRPDAIRGETVLLIDDVFTTGATVSACASAIKNAGAGAVYVLTVARALHR
jgi:ComF family protein